MVRPIKTRFIHFQPDVIYFKPKGVPLSSLEEVVLTVDELETMRLKNIEDLEQKECAKKMKISQSTFQRILSSANKKIAEALIKGRAIKIEGGIVNLNMIKPKKRKFKCEDCKNEWEVPFGTGKRGYEMSCPKCQSKLIHRIDFGGHGFGRQPWGYKPKK